MQKSTLLLPIALTSLCISSIIFSSESPFMRQLIIDSLDYVIDGRNLRTPWNPLIALVNEGNIQEVKRRVLNGARVDETVFYTLLSNLIAWREKFNEAEVIELINVLVQHGANLDQPMGELGSTVLHCIAKKRIMSVVDVILAAKPTIDAKDGEGLTPLHLATWTAPEHPRNLCLIEKLIAAGANTNALSIYGQTPLHYAVMGDNNKEAVQLLLEHGADSAIKDNIGKTACDYAPDAEVKTLLLEQV